MSKLSTIRKSMLVAAAVGVAAGTVMLSYAFTRVGPDGYNTATSFDVAMIFTLCPPAFGLMALDSASRSSQVVAAAFMVVENGVLYALVAGLIEWIVSRIGD